MDGVTTTATGTAGSTSLTVASGTGISNGDSVTGFGFAKGTTVSSGGGTTSLVLSTALTATLSASAVTFYPNDVIVTPGDAGPGLIKAWVRFDPTAYGVWPGGTSTVTRVSGQTLATVTTTYDHGLNVGSRVFPLTGVAAGTPTSVLSVPTSKTFTFTSNASTAVTNASITFAIASIQASNNIHSIAIDSLSTNLFYVNFATPMPDAFYASMSMGNNGGNVFFANNSSTTTHAIFRSNIGASSYAAPLGPCSFAFIR